MKNKKWYEWLLPVSFAGSVLLCVILNVFGSQQEGLANIIVNGLMFIIVAVIFLASDLGSFAPQNSINADLSRLTKKIREDALNSHDYLWNTYQPAGEGIFEDDRLKELYRDYLFELNRQSGDNVYYRADIDNYFNTGLVDSVMHRNQLNQVPGALTGLGILGTFIGLSLGLQHFNTGSTAQITESIAPLMAGIKVAFHTSIYGMILSLVYNYVYKRKLYESEETVNAFAAAWKKYVIPDTSDDGLNRLLELSEKQLKATRNLSERMAEEVAKQLDPNFEKLSRLITDFERVAAADQHDALEAVVKEYLNEMNKALSGSFTLIKASVDENYRMQKLNSELTDRFAGTVTRVQDEMQKDIMSLSMQSENNRMRVNEEQQAMKEVIASCNDAADAADTLRSAIEKMEKSRRKS